MRRLLFLPLLALAACNSASSKVSLPAEAGEVALGVRVVAPRDRVRTGIVAVPLLGCSDAVATLIADAISLTPGTLTLEVRREPLTLYVHALDTRDVEELRKEIRVLEVLAVRAFGDAEALAGLPQDDTRVWRGR